MTTYEQEKLRVGCYIDESAGKADTLNKRTIEFAQAYGFVWDEMFNGCFDGLRGLELTMTLDDALSASHSGRCDDDVQELTNQPAIAAQLDAIGADKLRTAMKEVGAWDDDELADDVQNRHRAVWQAACNIRENMDQTLSEVSDDAVSFLNDIETRPYMHWTHEDNSLFLMADVDGARDDVGFVSHSDKNHTDECSPDDAAYPADDYRGEWLHVSDHGNATLYVRGDNGQDVEVWGVV